MEGTRESLHPELAGIFRSIRKDGFIPVVVPDKDNGDFVWLDIICAHGIVRWSTEVEPNGDHSYWDLDVEDDTTCCICLVEARGLKVLCPKCRRPAENIPESVTLKLYHDERDFFTTAACSDCNVSWLVWCGEGEKEEMPARFDESHRGRWAFYAGKQIQAPRNGPCPCGSEKKFKKCCIGTYETVGPTEGQNAPERGNVFMDMQAARIMMERGIDGS